MNILFLSIRDYASSALRYAQALNQYTEHTARLVKVHCHPYSLKRPEADLVLTVKGTDRRIAQKWAEEADIIHFKGDDLPKHEWFQLSIPKHKPLICTVGGSAFRRGVVQPYSLGIDKFEDYIKNTIARTAITPDLNYPEFKGLFLPHAYDTSKFQNEWKYREKSIIAHCFWERNKKGTEIFLAAMKILKSKGHKFDVDIIESVTNNEVLLRKKRATYYFDQCLVGWYGMSAIEAMGFGIPTVAHLSDRALMQADGRFNHIGLPILNVQSTPEDIAITFDVLLNQPEKDLRDLSIRTKTFVGNVHSYSKIGQELSDLYEVVMKPTIKEAPVVIPPPKPKIKETEGILFICKKNSDNFATNWLDSFGVKVTKMITIPQNVDKIREKIENHNGWTWIEWGGDFTRRILDKWKTERKIMVRVHDWEIDSGYIRNVDWSTVNLLWFINRDSRRDFYNKMPHLIDKPSFFLPNAVDTSIFKIRKRKYGKKILAVSVVFKQRKGYRRLLEFYRKLKEKDSEWKLTIKSPVLDGEQHKEYTACKKYSEKHSLGVKFDISRVEVSKLKEKDDIINYMKGYDVIVSTSFHEGFHYSIAEGTLLGLKPLVYKWEWGRPSDFWSPFLYNSFSTMISELLEWGELEDDKKQIVAKHNAGYVKQSFSSKVLAKKLEETLFNKKKILIVAHNHPFKMNPRGAEHSFRSLCVLLKGIGYEVVVVVRNFKNTHEGSEIIEGINVQVFHEHLNSDNFNLKKRLGDIIETFKPDIGITYGLAAPPAAEVFHYYGVPYVLGVRWWRLIAPVPPGNIMEREIDVGFKENFKHVFKNASSIITNNKFATKVIRKYYGVGSLYSYVPLTPSIGKWHGCHNGHILLVSPHKDLGEEELLRKLVILLPQEKFMLVHVLNNDIFKFKSMGDNVFPLPYQDDMSKIYQQAKVILYPVYNNDVCGTSRVTIEAMSYGVPAICNARSGMDEISPFSVSRDASPKEWADLINMISQDYMMYSRMAYQTYLKYDMYTQMDVFVNEIERVLDV